MTKSDYLNFSRMGGKERLCALADKALDMLEKAADAPHAAKKNLMETDFKIAVAIGNQIKTLVQAESANTMAMAILADRMGTRGGADFIEANVPGLKIPQKQLEK
jgi:hypothetical protein